ncbi:hypothetical protein U1Q18_051531 [Sarracenia purpurea var. burkii]
MEQDVANRRIHSNAAGLFRAANHTTTRLGKSTNMDMLRRFYEIEVDDQGNRLPPNRTINNKLFLGGEIQLDANSPPKKLKSLKISLLPGVLPYMGSMPVIFLTLNNVTGKSYEEIELSIKSRIVETFQRHRYLLNRECNDTFHSIFNAYHIRRYFTGDFNTTELKRSLFVLSGSLHEYFDRRRVVVLVDDYDVPVINAFLEFGHKQQEYDKVIDLLDSMYQLALKGNIFLHKALVTGKMRLAFDTLAHPIARLDNLEICTLFCRRFCYYYGFTREEVRDLLERLPTSVQVQQMDNWYGGYTIYEHTYLNSDLVMQSVSHNVSLGYYEQSGIISEALLDKVFATDKIQPRIQYLISGHSINFHNFMNSCFMRVRLHSLPGLDVLLHYGYLNKTDSLTTPEVAIPNKQIQHIYETKSLQWVASKFGVSSSQFISFANCLSNGSIDQFRETLPKYLPNAAYLIQAGEQQSKAVFNGMIIALQTALSSSHRKTTDGPTDGFILIPTSDRNDKAIIFKYKTTKKKNEMASEAKSSIEEINRYMNSTSLKNCSYIRKIHKIGLAFCGINVTVEDQIENILNLNEADGI